MNLPSFRFKQFEISDKSAAMKLGTDAVLLGAWAALNTANYILDIGTGCGILALMAAQRNSTAAIDAVEIDESSCKCAKNNFNLSPWVNRISLCHQSFQDYFKNVKKRYDGIIVNPPYFSKQLQSPDYLRNQSRHNQALPFDVLIYGCKTILADDGCIHMVIPDISFDEITKITQREQLFFNNHCIVTTNSSGKKKRHLITLGKKNTYYITDNLIIRDAQGNYTEQYKELTKDFYIIF